MITKKLNNISIIKVVKFLFLLFSLAIFFNAFFIYPGNIFYYIFFTIVSNFYFIYSLRKDSYLIDFFLSLFLWLGLWFKFSVQLIFSKFDFYNLKWPEGVGNFDFSKSSFDEVSTVCSISILTLIFSSLLVKKLFFNYKKYYQKKKIIRHYFSFTKRKLYLVSFVFIISFIIFYFLNFYFSIYQKGIVYEGSINSPIYNIIVWFIKIGFPVLISMVLFISLNLRSIDYKIKSVSLSCFESSISSISQLSRAVIFNPFSMIFGIFKYNQFQERKFTIKNFIKSYVLISLFALIAIIAVSELRYKFYNLEDSTKESRSFEDKISNHFSNILYLIGNRWVGIEGVMSAQGHQDKGIILFKSSFGEKYNFSNTFYEVEFKKNEYVKNYEDVENYITKQKLKHIFIFTPGIIGFLYYSGSLFFLSFVLSLIFIFCALVEIIIFKLSRNNFIYTSLMCNTMAYHLAHFGYMPQNSYKIIFGILLGLVMVMSINKIIYNK